MNDAEQKKMKDNEQKKRRKLNWFNWFNKNRDSYNERRRLQARNKKKKDPEDIDQLAKNLCDLKNTKIE